jgi:hypothetical protein
MPWQTTPMVSMLKKNNCKDQVSSKKEVTWNLRKVTTTPAARGLEEHFSAVLERFLQPLHALHVYCKN